MSTQNPCNADNWFKPQVHPCKAQFEHIKTNQWDKDNEDLLNSVQRHTQCSTAYCLHKKAMKVNFRADLISQKNAVIKHT